MVLDRATQRTEVVQIRREKPNEELLSINGNRIIPQMEDSFPQRAQQRMGKNIAAHFLIIS